MTAVDRAAAAPPAQDEGRGAGIAALVLALVSLSCGAALVVRVR